MMVFQAEEIGEFVKHLIDAEEVVEVHSVFNTSFNLIVGTRLIHVGSSHEGLAPFGIGLCKRDALMLTQNVKQGERVFSNRKDSSLQFNHGLVIKIEKSTKKKNVDTHFLFADVDLVEIRDLLTTEMTKRKFQSGLMKNLIEQEAFLQGLIMNKSVVNELSVLDQQLFNQVLILEERIKGTEVHRELYQESFDYFVGRGPGLTPSGDDLLTGITAVIHAFGLENQQFIDQLGSYLKAYGRQRTTAVANEYLYYAIEHAAYHSSISGVQSELGKNDDVGLIRAIHLMEEIGHTSGADTLLGMIICISALIKS